MPISAHISCWKKKQLMRTMMMMTCKIIKFTKVQFLMIVHSMIVPCLKHSFSSACSPPHCRQRGKEQLRSALKMSRRLDDLWGLRKRELLIDVGRLGSLYHTCDGFLCFPVGLTLMLPKEEPSLLVEASLCLPCLFEQSVSLVLLRISNENFAVSKCTQSPQWQGGVHSEL